MSTPSFALEESITCELRRDFPQLIAAAAPILYVQLCVGICPTNLFQKFELKYKREKLVYMARLYATGRMKARAVIQSTYDRFD
jgi:hypothetical protein